MSLLLVLKRKPSVYTVKARLRQADIVAQRSVSPCSPALLQLTGEKKTKQDFHLLQ